VIKKATKISTISSIKLSQHKSDKNSVKTFIKPIIYKSLLLLVMFQVNVYEVQAHVDGHEEGREDDSPTAPIGPNARTRTYGGYGHIVEGNTNVTSEAQANTLVSIECDENSKRRLIESGCNRTLRDNERADQFITDSMRAMVFRKLNQQFLEFNALSLIAATAGSAREITQANLHENSNLRACNLAADNPIISGSKAPDSPEGERLRTRLRYVNHHVDTKNMARAFLAHEWMKTSLGDRATEEYEQRDHNEIPSAQRNITQYQFKQDIKQYREDASNEAPADFRCRDVARRNEGACVALQAQMFRLQSSFPALYNVPQMARGDYEPKVRYHESPFLWDGRQYDLTSGRRTPDGGLTSYTQPGMMTAIRDLIVANGGSYQSILSGLSKRSSTEFSAMEQSLIAAINKAEGADSTPQLRHALRQFNQVGQAIRDRHASQTRSRIDDLCSRRNFNPENFQQHLVRMMLLNPNVVRQFLIDADPQTRAVALAVLCQEGVMGYLRPERQCNNVSGGPLPGTAPIRTARRFQADFPFSSNHYTTISRPTDDDPYTVDLTVNLQLGPNVNSSDPAVLAQMQTLANTWRSDVNNYINCQSGAPGAPATITNTDGSTLTCPPEASMRTNPPVVVNVNFNIVPAGSPSPPPTMSMHQCFRAETGSSNCNAIRQWHIDRCVSGGDTLANCQSNTPPANTPSLNRQNAANLTLGTSLGTVRHEILHQLGLRDEYEDQRSYVFNEIGEHNSIMRSSGSLTSRLYPRHIEQLTSVVRCPGMTQ
jgi:hypothetical protein